LTSRAEEAAMRNRFLLVAVLLVLLVLDWAALHDILKGEPNVWMEWAVVALSAVVVALLAIQQLARRRGADR
jgi:4-amino-4-deoxy-L-arabinose transferase-like glycosyltransferase